jgi:hypothetical protein
VAVNTVLELQGIEEERKDWSPLHGGEGAYLSGGEGSSYYYEAETVETD